LRLRKIGKPAFLQDRQLTRECGEDLALDAADGEGAFLFALGVFVGGGFFGLLTAILVTKYPSAGSCLRLILAVSLDDVFDSWPVESIASN